VGKKDRGRKKSKSGGGTLSGLRGGFKSAVGVGGRAKRKESLASKLITYLLLAAAVGVLIYRLTR
jgi:hypothetical protein